MSVINTNVSSLISQNALKVNNRAMATAMNQLSTGNRINSAKDDAAGLAISENMTAQIRGLSVAVRNANDGISLAQTAEGAMIEISNMMQRMRELAVQSATGTVSDSQRDFLNTEFTQLQSQISNTISNTKWNGFNVLSTGAVAFTIQVGAESGTQTVVVTSAGLAGAYTAASITTVANASTAMGSMDTGLNTVNSARATLGAVVSRLTSVGDNLTNVTQNLAESRSRVRDTDYAAATTELARTQIIQQAGMAVLAQANQLPQSVLALLR
ncbi:MAG: flagellin [Betaproteobacteria bacterium]|jgi:flagellin